MTAEILERLDRIERVLKAIYERAPTMGWTMQEGTGLLEPAPIPFEEVVRTNNKDTEK